MGDSVLIYDDSLGFCTWIESTKSRLFSQGCSVTSESMNDDTFWFSASVPSANSNEFALLRKVVNENSGRSVSGLPDATPILVEVAFEENILAWNCERQAKFANLLINRFLRAYEHTYFDVLVPRHCLDGRAIVMVTPDIQQRVEYTPVTLDLGHALDHYLPSHVDVEHFHLQFLMGTPDAISPSWRILVDGARHFENGNIREAVLCACSAAEIVACPAVERWLERNTVAGDRDSVRSAVREMGNPLRFDLCISGACTDAFSDIEKVERAELLAELRRMNALRNSVVHQGVEPEAAAAARALRAAASFICKVWLATLGLGSTNADIPPQAATGKRSG